MKSNPNPSFYPALPYESLSSCMSINKKINEKKMKRNINIDLAVLPSHDTFQYIPSSNNIADLFTKPLP